MSYLALYRTLRPQNFNQVVGQEHIVKTLVNQLETNRVNHAYLFCGTRGTGKTSTAKIFAKVLNCENPTNNIPCDICEMCTTFNQNRNFNIAEIDAASNNSVNHMRELKEEVKYPPTSGKYKIYIIDEVHMLTTEAFNALLKTLEEPPEHVIFILATTDTHKIPVTILSRTQRFDFKRISDSNIVKNMKDYLNKENIVAHEDALFYIAKLSDGAMRDALSILEKCISFYFEQDITLEKVLDITGAVDDEVFFYLTDKLVNFEISDILTLIDEVIQDGRDISKFIVDTINHFRKLLIVKINSNKVNDNIESNIIYVSKDKLKAFTEQANLMELKVITKLINYFLDMQNIIKNSSDKRIILEMYCIKICNAISMEEDNLDYTDIQQKIKFLENKLEKVTNPLYTENPNMSSRQIQELIEKAEAFDKFKASSNSSNINNIINTSNTSNETIVVEEPLRELAVSEDIKEVIKNYKKLVDSFTLPQKIFIEIALPKSLEDKFLYLVIDEPFKSSVEKILGDIEEHLFKIFNKHYSVKVVSKMDYRKQYKKIALSNPQSMLNNNLDKDLNIKEELNQEQNQELNQEVTIEKIAESLPIEIVQFD